MPWQLHTLSCGDFHFEITAALNLSLTITTLITLTTLRLTLTKKMIQNCDVRAALHSRCILVNFH